MSCALASDLALTSVAMTAMLAMTVRPPLKSEAILVLTARTTEAILVLTARTTEAMLVIPAMTATTSSAAQYCRSLLHCCSLPAAAPAPPICDRASRGCVHSVLIAAAESPLGSADPRMCASQRGAPPGLTCPLCPHVACSKAS